MDTDLPTRREKREVRALGKDSIVAQNLYAMRMKKSAEIGQMLPRQAVADAVGVSAKTLANWEHGSHSISIECARCLADFYGCSLDELAGRTPVTV